MERTIADALEPVLADIRATGAPEPLIVDGDWDPELQSAVVLVRPDGSGAGVGVLRDASRASRVVQVADGTQDWVIESLWALRRPTNWPICPAHPRTHPLTATLERSIPTWRCPVDPDVRMRIGELTGVAGQPAETR